MEKNLDYQNDNTSVDNPQILYIEDDAAMRKLFQLLQSSILKPYQFVMTETIAEAKQILQLHPKKFSAIVSDYFLPDGEAKDLFPLSVDLPVIVLTATYDVNLAVDLMKLGVEDFVVKDKDAQFIKLMPEKIASVVEKKQSEKEAAKQERKFRDLFENSLDIILYLREDGTINQTNEPFFEILGPIAKSAEKLIIFKYIHPNDIQFYKKVIQSLVVGQSIEDLTVRMRNENNVEYIMEGNVSKGQLNDESFYIRAIFRDVTQKRINELMIKDQNKALLQKNKLIEDGVIKLRNATVSRKASSIVFIFALALFFFSEFWLEPTLVKYSGNPNYNWILKIVIVVLLKPFDMVTERWLFRQKIKEAGLA